jgi:hypothetical protein
MFSTSSSISWPPVYNTNDSNNASDGNNIHSALQLSTSNNQTVGSTASLSLPDHNDPADIIWNNAVSSHQEYNHPVVTQTITTQPVSAGLSPTDANFTNSNITPPLSSNIPLHLHNTNANSTYSWSSAHSTSNDMYNCSMTSSSSLASETNDNMNTNFFDQNIHQLPSNDLTAQQFQVPQYMPLIAQPIPLHLQQQLQMQQLQFHQAPMHLSPPPLGHQRTASNPPPAFFQPRRPSVEELTETKRVKLTKMSNERIEKIKTLAAGKGITADTVLSVLTLYTPEGRKRCLNTVTGPINDNTLDSDDIYLDIVMNGGGDDDPAKRGKKAHTRKTKPNHIKRPLNSFMLYRKSQTQSAMAFALHGQLKLNHQNISQIIGLMWQTEDQDVKRQFAVFASKEKELHKFLHPDYKFCPQKKKKRD